MPSQSHRPTNQTSPPPIQTASVTKLATGEAEDENRPLMQQRLLDRVKKCLERASHPNTTEFEAKAAWCMASRVMAQYNVTQTSSLNDVRSAKDISASGGESVVAITRRGPDATKVVSQAWVGKIAGAMTILFDCKAYYQTRLTSIEWIFYGIAANTVLAAMAFENAHNLTLAWAAEKRGRNAKHSYSLGVGTGLVSAARYEKKKEEQRTRETEQQNNAGNTATNHHDPEIDTSNHHENNPWNSSQALVRFQQSAQKVADEYLKAHNMKLRRGPRRGNKIRNRSAFQAGINDSKNINVKRRRIENA